MGVTRASRRDVLKRGVLGWVGAVTAPLWPVFEQIAPRRYVQAVRTLCYPGRVETLSEEEAGRPGIWLG